MSSLRKPAVLLPGDRVAIIAPSSPFESANLERGVAWLREQGLEPVWDEGLEERFRYLAGTDAHRARALQAALADDQIRGVFCARGGYGSARLLSHLDVNAFRSRCKVFVGFSDVTTLHLFLQQSCGWVTFHGPMVATKWAGEGFDEDTARSLIAAVTSTEPPPPIHAASARTLREGRARGPLVGGNLSLLCHSIGTSNEIETEGTILLLEDVHEAPYRIDRMLTHLRQAGKLTGVRGVIVGDMVDCDAPAGEDYTVEDVIAECLADVAIPVLTGFPISHGKPNHTVPLGVDVELDADARTLTFLEAGVVEAAEPTRKL